ncbi:conserved hypothetical protein [Parafrankia sp. Ea1.12]|nr:conserved hypothetical protein [Parafrankia sp. Ea1.12]
MFNIVALTDERSAGTVRRSARLLASIACVLMFVAACGGGGFDIEHPSPSRGGAGADAPTTDRPLPPARSYDPPVHFNRDAAAMLPDEASEGAFSIGGDLRRPLPVALVGTVAYIAATDHLLVVETRTGQQLGAPIRPESGSGRVYAAFIVDIPGSGTTPGHRSVELVGIEAPGARPVTRATVPLEQWASQTSGALAAAPVWSDGRTVLVRVSRFGDSPDATTYAIDATSGKIRWRQDDFAARVVAGDTAVGEVPSESFPAKVSGLSLSDGGVRWTNTESAHDVSIFPGGPSLVVAYGQTLGSQNFLSLLDAATGTVKDRRTGSYNGVNCQYDAASVTVCYQGLFGSPWAAAFDTTTGSWLWGLPDSDANRVAPTITSAWHGAVYGTTRSGPVILDARTGKDRATAPGAAPFIVNGNVGLALDPNESDLWAFPADG